LAPVVGDERKPPSSQHSQSHESGHRAQPPPPPRWARASGSNEPSGAHSTEAKAAIRPAASKPPPAASPCPCLCCAVELVSCACAPRIIAPLRRGVPTWQRVVEAVEEHVRLCRLGCHHHTPPAAAAAGSFGGFAERGTSLRKRAQNKGGWLLAAIPLFLMCVESELPLVRTRGDHPVNTRLENKEADLRLCRHRRLIRLLGLRALRAPPPLLLSLLPCCCR
jgi:hypothetical protein